jgi:hypothetical protein
MSRGDFQCFSTDGWIPSSTPKRREIIRIGALTIQGRWWHSGKSQDAVSGGRRVA